MATSRITWVLAALLAALAATADSLQGRGETGAGCEVLPSTLTASSACRLLKSDTGSGRVVRKWGSVDCARHRRHRRVHAGGDGHRTATGALQQNRAHRRLAVRNGDYFFGRRCEIGRNSHQARTFALYREGQRRLTFFSLQIPKRTDAHQERWRVVMQMKQTQPSDNGSGTPALSIQLYGGRWHLLRSDSPGPASSIRILWSAPARKRVWTRFAVDATYSRDPGIGKVRMYVDRNGDGDALDSMEQTPTFRIPTLKHEIAGTDADGLRAGDSIPSHLRLGVYQDERIRCRASARCRIRVDNVQVLR